MTPVACFLTSMYLTMICSQIATFPFQCRFHVVRRSDGQLLDTPYISAPFFVFHHINAYEEDNHIIMDLCSYDNGEVVNSLYVKALEELFSNPKKYQEPFESRARRYVLPLSIDKNQKVRNSL